MDIDRSKYIDLDGALNRMRGNKTLYKRMLQLFLNSKEFDAFEEHLAANDMEKAGDVAHAIKGMTGNLSLTLVFELSAKLMTQLRDQVLDEETIAAYRDAYEKTRAYVEELMTQL